MMTLEELNALDETEIMRGYEQARLGYSLSGHESKAFVHGWRNGQCDFHGEPLSEEQIQLARDFVNSKKKK